MEIPDKIIGEQIKRGSILHSTMFPDIDHGKFFVVADVTDEYIAGFFFINSNIHKSIFNKQEQLNMQYPIRKSDYSFLRYDSFINATNLTKRHKNYIIESIKFGETQLIGNMKEEQMNELLENARNSKLFSKRDKELFFK